MRTSRKIQFVAINNVLILVLVLITIVLYSCSHSNAQNTSDWKTYTNQKHGYKLLYPPDLTVKYPVKGYSGSVRFMRDSKICFSVVIGSKSPNARVTYEGKMVLLSSLSLKERIILALRQVCYPPANHKYSKDKKKIKWNDITIGKVKGMQAYASDDACISKYLPASLLIRNNRSYLFNTHLGSENEYNRILSTVRFIE
jgi:hypothetical protein